MHGFAIEFNTFTVLGRCKRTGALGVATSTGEMAVGSRVPFVRTGVGAVATQALTDPRHGPKGIALLEEGLSAADVVDRLSASDPHIEARQIAVVDSQGRTAARTGGENRDWKGHHEGDQFIAMGNRLTSAATVDAMVAAFGGSADEAPSIGTIVGPAFPYERVVEVVETLTATYLAIRSGTEQFIDTVKRVGLDPFKEALYADH